MFPFPPKIPQSFIHVVFVVVLAFAAMPLECADAQGKQRQRESPAAKRIRARLLAEKLANKTQYSQQRAQSHSNTEIEPPQTIPADSVTRSIIRTAQLPQRSDKTSDSAQAGLQLITPNYVNQASRSQNPQIQYDLIQPLEFESAPPNPSNSYSLESLLELAVQDHPTLNTAAARINTARQEGVQAGLAPNPQLGLFLDEIGNEDDPGILGLYLQRKVLRGNKLALAQRVKSKEATVREIEQQAQAVRIETDVRTAFYRALVSQRKQLLSQQLLRSQRDAVDQAEKLFESGETPKTDLLQTRLQAQKSFIMVSQAELDVKNAWRRLAVVTGNPQLPFASVTGSLDEVVEPVTFEQCRQHVFQLSPELKSALAEVERVQATISRELAQQIPDYQTQVTVGKDSATEHFFAGIQLQMPLMICDRNQGNIAVARSRLVEASNNVETIKLQLSQRLAAQYQKYQAAQLKTNLYNSKLIPQAQESLDLLTLGYPLEVEIFQILTAQQLIVEFTFEYLDSLNDLWVSRSKIEGLLLEESLSD